MEDLSNIISSLSPDDISKLQDMANSIFGNTENSQKSPKAPEPEGISPDTMAVLNTLVKTLGANNNDEKTVFIKSLKPLLSPDKQGKADEAIKIMQLLKFLPILRDQGIL